MSTRTPEHAFERVETNGISYGVSTYGAPTQPAVVLLHGWLGTSHSWRKLVPLLSETHFVIVPDMRGHGETDKPADGYDAANLARDVAGILDAIGLDEAHIVGHDMGALVALVFAGTMPERALSLTYLDEPLVGVNLDEFTVYRPETHGGYWHFGFNTVPGLPELLLAGSEQAFVDFIVPQMHAPNPDAVTDEDRRVYAASLQTENGILGSVGWYRAAFQTGEQIRSLGDSGIAVPVMAWGGQFGVPKTQEQFGLIGIEARGGVFEGVGHLIAEEIPDELATELLSFFSQVSS